MHGNAQQLSFEFGPDAEPRRRATVFFAIKPDRQAAARIVETGTRLGRLHRLGGPMRRPDQLHISLVGFRAGLRAHRALIEVAMAAGAAVRWPSFEVALHAGLTFGGGSRVLRCDHGACMALRGLRDAVLAAVNDRGLRLRGPSDFAPHVTVANDKAPMPETLLPAAICWPAQELLLLLNKGDGRGHVVLSRWPLGQKQAA